MYLPKRSTKAFTAGMILAVMVAVWILLAPSQFGGQASYVMVAGASMEPTLHRGDLVVVREMQAYQIGDVVTYRHPTIGPIIHRIIDRSGERFIFKGDNNDWIDSYEPVEAELIGKEWLYIPGAANWLLKLRLPAGLALLSLATAIMIMITVRQNAAGANENKQRGRKPVVDAKEIRAWSGNLDGIVFALGAIALGAFLLGLLSFTKPLTVSTPDDIAYEHHGTFEYHHAAPTSIYDDGMLSTGDPIFHQLVPRIKLNFNYQFITHEPAALNGSYALSVEVGDSSGWQRTVELIPETYFSGEEAILSGEIDVQKLVALTELLRNRTGSQRQVYAVGILPAIEVQGWVGGAPFQDRFAPRLAFQLDDLEMYLTSIEPLNDSGNPLTPSAGGYIPRSVEEPATLSILGLVLTVKRARWIAGVGFALGVFGLAALLFTMRKLSKSDPMLEVLIQYGELLVEVEQFKAPGKLPVIDIHSLEDMAKLAERTGNLIFYTTDDDALTFQVRSAENVFRFEQQRVIQDPADDAILAETGDVE